VLAIVAAGFALCVFFFHLVRLHQSRPARRGDAAVIAAWLDGETEAPALVPVATQPLS
jgi:hypothetical protein